ncbi:Hpt domain-containing protein [Butyrivibrio sp. MC2013]|uniref:Hpt domain-containing protein n=1 Tax=Butyrivibrio sp. MC2013 TaxID=1280686 RepID=UPI0003FA3150|nr:Hpt domain-containing protein [Butyrivibrio sp. MC2013]
MTKLDEVRNIVGVSVEDGIALCAGDEDLYIELLGDYLEGEKSRALEESFTAQDWKNYGVYVHSVKGTSLTLGIDHIGSMARDLSDACKRGDHSFIEANHHIFMESYRKLLDEIRRIIQ